MLERPGGGIGRRRGLKPLGLERVVRVQVPSRAQLVRGASPIGGAGGPKTTVSLHQSGVGSRSDLPLTMRRDVRVVVIALLGLTSCSASDETAATTVPSVSSPGSATTPASDDGTTSSTTQTSPAPTALTTETATSPASDSLAADPSLRVSPGGSSSVDLGDWSIEERNVIHTGHIYWDLILRSLNTDQADPEDPDYVLYLTGPAQQTLRNVASESQATTRSTRGDAVLQPISVDIFDNTAVLVECVLDAVDTLDANGGVTEPADTEYTVWETTIVWRDPFWQTSDFRRLDGTCELDAEHSESVPFEGE